MPSDVITISMPVGGAALVVLVIAWIFIRVRRARRRQLGPPGSLVLPAVELPAPRRRLAHGSVAPVARAEPGGLRRASPRSLRPSHARRA
jgi:hypothetical protein